MGSVPPLLTFLSMIVSGWVHRHELIIIEFLQAENQLLKQSLASVVLSQPFDKVAAKCS